MAISFTDVDSGDDAWAGVRVEGQTVGLALSLKENGDIEVSFGKTQLDQLIDGLQKAREALAGESST